MKTNKSKQYIKPHSKVVRVAPLINSGHDFDPETETGHIGIGSEPKDAGLGQAKRQNTFEEDAYDTESSSWNVWEY